MRQSAIWPILRHKRRHCGDRDRQRRGALLRAAALCLAALAYALFEVPSGWLVDRFGARFMLTRIVCDRPYCDES